MGNRAPLARAGAVLRLGWGAGVALALAAAAEAAVCTVPGSHAKIQLAIADPACSTIQLGAQSYAESIKIGRALTLAGPPAGGAVLAGRLTAIGAGAAVQVTDLVVANGCPDDALRSIEGAAIAASGVSVQRDPGLPCPPDPIFADGFEGGTTAAWSYIVP